MANTKVTGDVIANGTISTVHIADDAITAAKLDSTATGITFADLTVSATTATLNLSGSNTGASLINFGDSDDGNVGRIYYDHTSNFMQFKTNDSEKMRINNSGNVGIGTASPSYALDVEGDVQINNLLIAKSGSDLILQARASQLVGINSGGSRAMTLDASQRVGVGTASPDSILHVESNGSTSANFILESTHSSGIPLLDLKGASSAQLRYKDSSDVIQARIDFDNSGTFNFIDVPNNSSTLYLKTGGNVGIGTTTPGVKLDIVGSSSGSITNLLRIQNPVNSAGTGFGASLILHSTPDSNRGVAIASSSATNYATNNDMLFYTSSSSALYERMRIDSNGQVGIGTTSPSSKLEIAAAHSQVRLTDTDDSKFVLYSYSGGKLIVRNNSIDTTTNQFTLTEDGKFGIGTISPAQKLHVVGKMQISDDIKLAQTNGRIDYDNGVSTGALRFWSTSGNSERMRITSAGNVGIGETSPLVPLHISRDSASGENIALLLDNNNTTAGNEIGILFRSAVGSTNTDFEIFGKANGANDMDLVFQSDGSVERMRINGDGNVGIGADSPGTKLEVRQVDDTFDDLDLLTLKRVWSTASGSDRAHGIKFSDNNAILANIYADRTNSGSNYNSDLVFITNTGASGTDTSEKMRIDNGGSIHQNYISGLAGTSDYGFTIAKQTGYSQVYFRADTTSTRYIQRFYNDNSGTLQNVGNIIISGSTTSYATSSDYRLKENVVEMTGALDRISQLKPSRFNFIGDADKTVDGFLAHEVQDIVPEAITGEKDSMRTEEYEVTPVVLDEEGNITEEAVMGTREVPEYQGIDQSKLVPLLVGAIQELKADNDSLRARIEILENQ